ncbi:MAG: hypothetical protein ACOX6S_11625 [Clostridia bacterium]
MIQIDDAGSGSLIGGTCIGAMRVETLEYRYEIIPISYYRGEAFQQKKYLNKCTEIVKSLLEQLNVSHDEKIMICQGYMFEKARKWLHNEGFFYEKAKIGQPLQDVIEETFFTYALQLGIPVQYVKYTKYPLHFHRLLRWVYADYQKRVSLCKTGWKSWKKYGYLKVSYSMDVLYKSSYTCLKCNQKIDKGSPVKVLQYSSNCPNTIYLHQDC